MWPAAALSQEAHTPHLPGSQNSAVDLRWWLWKDPNVTRKAMACRGTLMKVPGIWGRCLLGSAGPGEQGEGEESSGEGFGSANSAGTFLGRHVCPQLCSQPGVRSVRLPPPISDQVKPVQPHSLKVSVLQVWLWTQEKMGKVFSYTGHCPGLGLFCSRVSWHFRITAFPTRS